MSEHHSSCQVVAKVSDFPPEAYYTAYEIAPDIYHIHEPGGVYTTLIIGEEKALLIDTGYGFCDLASFVKTLTDKPLIVIATHGHTDHVGGNYMFPLVYMNMAELPTYLWYATVQRATIVDKFRRDRIAAGLPHVWPEDFDEAAYLETKNRHFAELSDHQTFELGGRTLEIIFLPGHTEGSLVLFDHKTGLLFSGDNIAHSLWIFFDTSASLTRFASKLMDIQRDYEIRGVVYSHSKLIYPPAIIDDLLYTISCVDPETDSTFIHPRTGQPALKHREPCTCVEDIKYIYVVYEPKRI